MQAAMKSELRIESRVREVFQMGEMPPAPLLANHGPDCVVCRHLAVDLEPHRGLRVGADLIREVHQELAHLSKVSWQWILPHYMLYCLTPEAVFSAFETEFLIYALSPALGSVKELEITKCLDGLTIEQLSVVKEFLEYLASLDYWRQYCPQDLERAVEFLSGIIRYRGRKI